MRPSAQETPLSREAATADVVIVGAGAAGLMAGITAGCSGRHQRIVLLDGAAHPGAKILVSGGGRCNVTHDEVDASAFAGSSRHAINKVLRQFPVSETIRFFRDLGVELKREETGKLFPVSNRAQTVLDALTGAARAAGCRIEHPWRVTSIERRPEGFVIRGSGGAITTPGVILASGGKSLPRSGSDGSGYQLATHLGHTVTPHLFPALVPLLLPQGHFLTELSGVSVIAGVEVRSSTNKRLVSFVDSILCTHFGLSGPAILDASRYLEEARTTDPGARFVIDWLPVVDENTLEEEITRPGTAGLFPLLHRLLPERLARALLVISGIIPGSGGDLTRPIRRELLANLKQLVVPITGTRGFRYAEVTAGGIPLSEVHLDRMESRPCPGLYLCGEICDVDGRIGGYNFQWAWASGYVAGKSVGNGAAK